MCKNPFPIKFLAYLIRHKKAHWKSIVDNTNFSRISKLLVHLRYIASIEPNTVDFVCSAEDGHFLEPAELLAVSIVESAVENKFLNGLVGVPAADDEAGKRQLAPVADFDVGDDIVGEEVGEAVVDVDAADG